MSHTQHSGHSCLVSDDKDARALVGLLACVGICHCDTWWLACHALHRIACSISTLSVWFTAPGRPDSTISNVCSQFMKCFETLSITIVWHCPRIMKFPGRLEFLWTLLYLWMYPPCIHQCFAKMSNEMVWCDAADRSQCCTQQEAFLQDFIKKE